MGAIEGSNWEILRPIPLEERKCRFIEGYLGKIQGKDLMNIIFIGTDLASKMDESPAFHWGIRDKRAIPDLCWISIWRYEYGSYERILEDRPGGAFLGFVDMEGDGLYEILILGGGGKDKRKILRLLRWEGRRFFSSTPLFYFNKPVLRAGVFRLKERFYIVTLLDGRDESGIYGSTRCFLKVFTLKGMELEEKGRSSEFDIYLPAQRIFKLQMENSIAFLLKEKRGLGIFKFTDDVIEETIIEGLREIKSYFVEDMDEDGVEELLVVEDDSLKILEFEEYKVKEKTGLREDGLVQFKDVVDIDNDGDKEIIVERRDGTYGVYGLLGGKVEFKGMIKERIIFIGDCDLDGRNELCLYSDKPTIVEFVK
jgi:hypothetical protein